MISNNPVYLPLIVFCTTSWRLRVRLLAREPTFDPDFDSRRLCTYDFSSSLSVSAREGAVCGPWLLNLMGTSTSGHKSRISVAKMLASRSLMRGMKVLRRAVTSAIASSWALLRLGSENRHSQLITVNSPKCSQLDIVYQYSTRMTLPTTHANNSSKFKWPLWPWPLNYWPGNVHDTNLFTHGLYHCHIWSKSVKSSPSHGADMACGTDGWTECNQYTRLTTLLCGVQ